MPKKPKRKTQRNKADKLFSELIRKRNKGRCEVCNKVGGVAHHFIGRKNLTLRHDLKNGVNLCYTHHVGGNLSAHNDPIWFIEWIKNNRYEDYLHLVIKRRKLTTKVDYEQIIYRLERRY